jgi:hypothetical protein
MIDELKILLENNVTAAEFLLVLFVEVENDFPKR